MSCSDSMHLRTCLPQTDVPIACNCLPQTNVPGVFDRPPSDGNASLIEDIYVAAGLKISWTPLHTPVIVSMFYITLLHDM